MESEDRISAEDLISALEEVITQIKQGTFDEVLLQDIYDSVADVMGSKDAFQSLNEVNETTMNYTFIGWWVTSFLRKSGVPDNEIQGMFTTCPRCRSAPDS